METADGKLELPVEKSLEGLAQIQTEEIPLPDAVTVHYAGTMVQKVSNLASLFTMLIIIVFLVTKRWPNRNKAQSVE